MAMTAPKIVPARVLATGAWLVVLALLCACAARTINAQTAAIDTGGDAALRLPGAFSERTTLADLQAAYGPANVVVVTDASDGDGRRSVVLFPHDPARRAYVGFHDAVTLQGVQSISVRDAGSRWRGKQGVQVGMSFADLRARNGRPFYFSGFDDTRRAIVHDSWSPASDSEDYLLGKLDVGEGDHMYFGVELGLRKDVSDVDAYPHGESVSSDDPRYPRLAELVEVTGIHVFTSLDDEWE